ARDRALEDILVDNVVGKALTPAAENGLYQEFLKNASPTEAVRLRQVVLATQAEADQVKKQLAGGAAFEAVAMERSKDEATRFKGGDLGPMTTDTLPPPIAAALAGAKPGQLIGPIKTDQGWAVLRVDDRRPEPAPSLDQVRPQIIRFITYDQIKDLVLKLRSRSKIKVMVAPPPDVPGAPTEPASAPPEPAAAPPANTAPPPFTPRPVAPTAGAKP